MFWPELRVSQRVLVAENIIFNHFFFLRGEKLFQRFYYFRRSAYCHGVGGYVFRYDAAGTNHNIVANGNAG